MSFRTEGAALLQASLGAAAALASTASSDPQAVALLNQALSAAGGVPALAAIADFKATGTNTYYWAGQQVAGTATVLSTEGSGSGTRGSGFGPDPAFTPRDVKRLLRAPQECQPSRGCFEMF